MINDSTGEQVATLEMSADPVRIERSALMGHIQTQLAFFFSEPEIKNGLVRKKFGNFSLRPFMPDLSVSLYIPVTLKECVIIFFVFYVSLRYYTRYPVFGFTTIFL